METYELKVLIGKEKAFELLDIMKECGVDRIDLPPIPMTAVQAFLDGDRPEIYRFAVDGRDFMEARANKKSAEQFKALMQSANMEEFELAPVLLGNIDSFLQEKRDDIMTMSFELATEPKEKEEATAVPLPLADASEIRGQVDGVFDEQVHIPGEAVEEAKKPSKKASKKKVDV
jgi:hypothetical protein